MRKAWNIPNLPVYSLVTRSAEGANMNICTYVSAVSMSPKLYAIAVYEETKTLCNIEKSEFAVLQLLEESQFDLVKVLGQKTGFQYDKMNYLKKKNILETWMDFPVLKNVCALVLLKKISSQKTGDHQLFLFEVVKSRAVHVQYLSLNVLRQKNIIRG